MEEDISFRLTQNEAELLMNALQSQTTGIIQKMQQQYMDQTVSVSVSPSNDEEQILVEEGKDGN